MRAHIISLFPEVCKPYFEHSILGRAVEFGALQVEYYNPIGEVPTLKRVDSRPYGGGPGMVLQAEPFLRCYDKAKKGSGSKKVIFFSPAGVVFTQEKAQEYSVFDNLIFFCGHYEGIDERVAEAAGAERVSIGEYTLTGGEIPSLVVVDAVCRLLPGVLGNEQSCEDSRVAGKKVYTRPELLEYENVSYSVPKVLLSGNHKDIEKYRLGE